MTVLAFVFSNKGKISYMKKVIAGLLVVMALTHYNTQAQVSVHVNIGAQPVWGPVGYDYVEYYYLPDIEAYYYVPRHQYVYLSNGRWIFSTALPPRYASYNPYTAYKVVINEPRPYMHFREDRVKYSGYRGRSQPIIRDSRDERYYVVKGHPNYKGNGNGNGNGHYKNKNKDWKGDKGRGQGHKH